MKYTSRRSRPGPGCAFHNPPSLGTVNCCCAPHFCSTFHHTYPDDDEITPKYTKMYVYLWLARCSDWDCVCRGFRCTRYCCRLSLLDWILGLKEEATNSSQTTDISHSAYDVVPSRAPAGKHLKLAPTTDLSIGALQELWQTYGRAPKRADL